MIVYLAPSVAKSKWWNEKLLPFDTHLPSQLKVIVKMSKVCGNLLIYITNVLSTCMSHFFCCLAYIFFK